ncbi:MAG: hypothetical protein CL755_01805 [Chloroflexi bacterium]|nr:hypothetical protein [Chloroflexota bacterium]
MGVMQRASKWFDLWRFKTGLVILGMIVIAVIVLLVTCNLTSFYSWLIGWSTGGETWTDIMRNDPWIFWGFALVVFVGLFLFPPWAVGRLYVIACVFTLGFLGGHVFW